MSSRMLSFISGLLAGAALIALAGGLPVRAQEPILTRAFIHPETLSNSPATYTQVVTYTANGVTTVRISGQTASEPSGRLVGRDDLEAQARQAFQNLVAALEAAGATPEDVVKINAYIVGLNPGIC
jgi:enamine deaminase RidA (YjgF/YER057c/UK114 family)